MTIYPVIMAGGSGTRFWPLSRRDRPKQLLPLAGSDPLLVDTVRRLAPLARIDRTYVVCGPVHAGAVRKLLPRLPKANLIVEPVPRNTAACVGLAAIHLRRRDPGAILAMLPADHHVAHPARLRAALQSAARVAAKGHIATIGLRPTRAETGYGYLQIGRPLAGMAPARKVDRFVEKPDARTAARYLAGRRHLWNGGMFVFRADVILEEIERSLPPMRRALERIARDLGTTRYPKTLKRVFPSCQSISIDHGVMERSRRIAVVPADPGWSDLGSFATLPEVRRPDRVGNVIEGEAIVLDGRDNVVLARKGRPVALIGLREVIVVDAGDAILVCPRDRAQDVRKVVEELKRRGREELT
jgi:mannose-1-phosphate guanylyltransferase